MEPTQQPLIASRVSVADLLRKQARARPDAVAIRDGARSFNYATLERRVCRFAQALRAQGVAPGERVAILSENCVEYIELQLAAAKLGAIVACLNWRLGDEELLHCIRLVQPVLLVVSPRYTAALQRIGHGVAQVIQIGPELQGLRDAASSADIEDEPEPEAGLVILYTSGTTGLPKGALISQRAMVARALAFAADYGIGANDAYIAWSPLFHMAATDFSLATLMLGGPVLVHDGLDVPWLCDTLARERVGWLLAMPGMIEPLIEGLRSRRTAVRAVRMVGAMADLVPLQQIAELTRLVAAPYLNSFGATETGLAPASGALLAAGQLPRSLAKRESSGCSVRLLGADEREVALEVPGELALRGPTLFSGYWQADAVNAHDFRGGWFHMGDLFVRHADGTLDFVDRLKYLIKSGGENIYPAQIERVLLTHAQVADAVVVRKADAHWGEVPVAFVVLRAAAGPAAVDDTHAAPAAPAAAISAALLLWCRERLAGYQMPRELRLVDAAVLPRSSTGKIQRHEVERQLL